MSKSSVDVARQMYQLAFKEYVDTSKAEYEARLPDISDEAKRHFGRDFIMVQVLPAGKFSWSKTPDMWELKVSLQRTITAEDIQWASQFDRVRVDGRDY